MSKTIDIGLNEKSIQKLIRNLDQFANEIDKLSSNIMEDLSDIAIKEMNETYQNSSIEPSTDLTIGKTKNKKSIKTYLRGTQAIYTEFGTGTKGAINSHPIKNKFKLNPYNSGKTIREASQSVSQKHQIPEGTLYWTYKSEDGSKIYTQGIPAQKIVYNASNKVRSRMKEICKKRLEEVINKW